MEMDFTTVIPKLQEWAALYGLKIIAALAIFILGRWISKGLRRAVERLLVRAKLDATLVSFIGRLTYVALIAFVVIAALNQLGIQTTTFIAIVGAAGLAVGLALQDSLANSAAGMLMIIFRPFKTGDYIEGAGVAGTVVEIQIFSSHLKTLDNKLVIVPNAKLMGDNIINYSAMETRRVDLVIGIGYGDDLQSVREVLEDILDADSRVLKEPAPTIGVLELAESSVNFAVRPWVKTADYWDVCLGLTEAIKVRFDAEGITIPFPQRDLHMRQVVA